MFSSSFLPSPLTFRKPKTPLLLCFSDIYFIIMVSRWGASPTYASCTYCTYVTPSSRGRPGSDKKVKSGSTLYTHLPPGLVVGMCKTTRSNESTLLSAPSRFLSCQAYIHYLPGSCRVYNTTAVTICHAMPCHAVLHRLIPYHTIPFHTTPHHTTPYHAHPHAGV